MPSASTTYRTFRGIGPAVPDDLWEAMATVRAKVRRRSSVTNTGSPVTVDIDETLVVIHSESKAGTAATYKGGFGFHTPLSPMPPVRRWPRCVAGQRRGQHQRRSPLRVGHGSS